MKMLLCVFSRNNIFTLTFNVLVEIILLYTIMYCFKGKTTFCFM